MHLRRPALGLTIFCLNACIDRDLDHELFCASSCLTDGSVIDAMNSTMDGSPADVGTGLDAELPDESISEDAGLDPDGAIPLDAGLENDGGPPRGELPCFNPQLTIREENIVSAEDSSHREVRIVHAGSQFLMTWSSNDVVGGTESADYDILYRRSQNGIDWNGPFLLIPEFTVDDTDERWPDAAGDGQGNWVLVWHRFLGGSNDRAGIYASQSTDDGQSWGSPILIGQNTVMGYDSIPHLATDGFGTWVAVWHTHSNTGGDDGDIVFVRSIDLGQTWSSPEPVHQNGHTDQGGDNYPSIAAGAQGEFMVVWDSLDTLDDRLGGDLDTLWAYSTDGALTFSPPEPVLQNAETDEIDDGAPEVVADGAGGFLVVIQMHDTPGTIASARFPRGASTWMPHELIEQSGPTTYTPMLRMETDGYGHWILLGNEQGSSVNDREIVLNWSIDDAHSWSTQTPIDSVTRRRDFVYSTLATDGTGTWVAAWHTDSNPDRLRIATATCTANKE